LLRTSYLARNFDLAQNAGLCYTDNIAE